MHGEGACLLLPVVSWSGPTVASCALHEIPTHGQVQEPRTADPAILPLHQIASGVGWGHSEQLEESRSW